MRRPTRVGKSGVPHFGLEPLESRELLATVLQFLQTNGPAAVTVNQPVSFTVQAQNASTASEGITGVTFSDTLPTNFLFNPTASTPGLTLNSATNVVTGNLPPLAAGASAPVITIAGSFAPAAAAAGATTLSNLFNVTGNGPGAVPVSVQAPLDIIVNPAVDLAVTTSGSPTSVNINQPVTYTLNVTNAASLNDATHVIVTDTLPAGTTFLPGTSTPGLLLSKDGTTVVDLVGNLASGASQTVTISVMPTLALQGTTLTNSATVTGLEPDVNVSNNTASDSNTEEGSVAVNPAVNVSLTKDVASAVPGRIGTNQGLTYTLNVTNTGPSDAHNVVVTDNLPAGLSTVFPNIVASGGGVVTLNGTNGITVTYPTLAVGATQTIQVRTLTSGPFEQSTSIVNTASVLQDEFNVSTQTSASARTFLDLVSPTVVSVTRYGYHAVPTVIVVHFSKPLDRATVNPSNFLILDYGIVHGRFFRNSPINVPIANVVYDAAHDRAFLYPLNLLPLSHTYSVSALGVTDQVGNTLPQVSTTFINRSSVRGLFPPVINQQLPPVTTNAFRRLVKPAAHAGAGH